MTVFADLSLCQYCMLGSATISVLFFAIWKYGSVIDMCFIDTTSRKGTYLVSLLFGLICTCIAAWDLSGSIIFTSVVIIVSLLFFLCQCLDTL